MVNQEVKVNLHLVEIHNKEDKEAFSNHLSETEQVGQGKVVFNKADTVLHKQTIILLVAIVHHKEAINDLHSEVVDNKEDNLDRDNKEDSLDRDNLVKDNLVKDKVVKDKLDKDNKVKDLKVEVIYQQLLD